MSIDWDGPVVTEIDEQSTVSVPEPPSLLREAVVAKLQDNIDPFMHSNIFGIEVYKEAVRVASACTFD